LKKRTKKLLFSLRGGGTSVEGRCRNNDVDRLCVHHHLVWRRAPFRPNTINWTLPVTAITTIGRSIPCQD
jgi:hypothetical protein